MADGPLILPGSRSSVQVQPRIFLKQPGIQERWGSSDSDSSHLESVCVSCLSPSLPHSCNRRIVLAVATPVGIAQ